MKTFQIKIFLQPSLNLLKIVMVFFLMIAFSPSYGQEGEKQLAENFTLKSQHGKNIKLSELTGQVVLLDFWASWCGTCIQQFTILEKLQHKYKDKGFTVLAINIERNTKKAASLARRIKADFTILFDSQGQLSRSYAVESIPMGVLIDRDGYKRELLDAEQLNQQAAMENKIEALLSE